MSVLGGLAVCLSLSVCLSVHRRQKHKSRGRSQSQERGWGQGWQGAVFLLIIELGAEPTPIKSHDSLGSLAKEERKRAGSGRGAGTPLSFSVVSSFLVTHSVLFLSKGLGQSNR